MLLAHWEHDLNPFLWHIWGPIGIRWYGLSYLLGIVAAWWLIRRWARAGRAPLGPGEPSEFITIAAIAMMIGGRLGYCIFYAPEQLMRDPLFVIKLHQGGMASHGGMIGMALGVYYYARSRRRDFLVLADTIGATGPIGVIAGRLANFVNGELWGRPSDVPWAVIFPAATKVDGVNVPRHPSQLYGAALEGVLPLLAVLIVHPRHRRPGLTLGVALIAYGIGRFVDEFWREPDAGYELLLGWMSKGQALSIPVVLCGLLLSYWAATRPAKPDTYPPPNAT